MDIYDELGITTFINAYRPLTRLGGTRLPDRVINAMCEASRKNVSIRLMHERVGEAIASLTNNEAAYISCGAASGITLGVAACMTGTDPVLGDRLPCARGMKNEVIMHVCDRGYKSDVAIRCAGATIHNIGTNLRVTENDLHAAINKKTAAILVHDLAHPSKLSLQQMITIAQEHHIPVLVDAAFSVPPKESLWKFTRDGGADAVFISGGKGLRGPQSTGLVLGKSWIVRACAFHGVPNNRIGVGMKVGKEELAGIYAAVKLFMEQDDAIEQIRRERQIDHITSSLESISNVTVQRVSTIRVIIKFDHEAYRMDPGAASRWLRNTQPAVYVEATSEGLIFTAECLEDGEEKIVATKLLHLFKSRN